jgi:hypothetical protein
MGYDLENIRKQGIEILSSCDSSNFATLHSVPHLIEIPLVHQFTGTALESDNHGSRQTNRRYL